MFSWLSFCILTVSEDLGSFGEQGKGTHIVYLYIWNILSPFPKCNLLDFDALWFYIMAKFEWVSDKITVILCNMSWHVKDEFLRGFLWMWMWMLSLEFELSGTMILNWTLFVLHASISRRHWCCIPFPAFTRIYKESAQETKRAEVYSDVI